MNKKSKYLFIFLGITIFLLLSQTIYLYANKSLSKEEIEKKEILIKAIGLPDLAISTEAMYTRHRTLSDIFSLFKDSPLLREYFPSTYVYSHSHILNNTPSNVNEVVEEIKVNNEK
ncbi:MAG: hypothetical protein WBF48_03880 [Halarcobacter sp.]